MRVSAVHVHKISFPDMQYGKYLLVVHTFYLRGEIPLSFIPGTASFMVWNAAVRLIAIIWSHLSAEYCSKGATCQIPSGNRGREGRREGREKRRKGEAEGGEEEEGRRRREVFLQNRYPENDCY